MRASHERSWERWAKTKKGTAKKSGGQSSGKTTGVAKKPEEIRKIRNQVTNVILNGSLAMTNRVVREVSEEGNINALKFLWETARLFPTGEAEEDPNSSDALAKSLLKALGLPLEPPSEDEEESEETKQEADVESEEVDEAGEDADSGGEANEDCRGQIAEMSAAVGGRQCAEDPSTTGGTREIAGVHEVSLQIFCRCG